MEDTCIDTYRNVTTRQDVAGRDLVALDVLKGNHRARVTDMLPPEGNGRRRVRVEFYPSPEPVTLWLWADNCTFVDRVPETSAADADWRDLVDLWWLAHRGTPQRTWTLFSLAERIEGISAGLGNGTVRSRKIRFGKAVERQRDHAYAGKRIVRSHHMNAGAYLYHLEQTSDPADPKATE